VSIRNSAFWNNYYHAVRFEHSALAMQRAAQTIAALDTNILQTQVAQTIAALDTNMLQTQVAKTIAALDTNTLQQVVKKIAALDTNTLQMEVARKIAALDTNTLQMEVARRFAELNIDTLEMEVGTTIAASDRTSDEIRRQVNQVKFKPRVLADMDRLPPQTPRVLSLLSDYLPEHLQEYKDEIREFVEDGIADRANSGLSTNRFILWEALNLVLLAFKSKLIGLGNFRSRTDK